MEKDRTEVIQTNTGPTHREVVTPAAPTRTEVHATSTPRAAVDRTEAVAYDPFAPRRMAAYRVTQMIYWVFGLVGALIAIRIVLKALGANPAAGFAEFIYGMSWPLVLPFVGLFANPQSQGSVLELTSIVALIVYALAAWLLAKLAWILVADNRSAVKTHATQYDSRL
jgi:hypothetical protein